MLVTLKEILSETREKKYAIGGFSGGNFENLSVVLQAAEKTNTPVIVMEFWPAVQDMWRRDVYFRNEIELMNSVNVPVCLHLDHASSYEYCVQAIASGFTSVMFDGSSLPLEENIAQTKRVVEVAHACGVSVEAEIGHVGGGDGLLVKEGLEVDTDMYTKPEEAKYFAEQTQVDALAVAIGTVHGIFKGTPKLDFDLLDTIRDLIQVPLVLHGGSGVPDEQFRQAVEHGISKINFCTNVDLAGAEAAKAVIKAHENEPVHLGAITGAADQAMIESIIHQIGVFNTQPLAL